MEVEFHEETAIFANLTPDSTSRSDLTVEIDESVTPALITLTGSGEKLAGIIRFEPHAVDSGFQPGSMGMSPNEAMSSGGMGGGGSSLSGPMTDRLLICFSQGGSLRPWQFASDPDHGITLFELIRSEDPEPLRSSLILEPLPNESTASVVKESVEAWSKHLKVPIERRNSIGLDLTLVPPTSVDLPPDEILQDERLLLPEGTKVVDENSPKSVPSIQSPPQPTPPQPKPSVSYPFVISRDVISMAQFQQFVADTGYVTDAEKGEPLTAAQLLPPEPTLPTERAPATDSDVIVEDATTALPAGTIGGWIREEGKFVWHDGVSWKTPDSHRWVHHSRALQKVHCQSSCSATTMPPLSANG